MQQGLDDDDIAWQLTDQLVRAGPGGLPARLGGDARRRRLRQLRARSAAGRPEPRPAARGARRPLHRAGQAVVGRPQEPHDQGARHAGRPGRAGRAVRRRHDAQRDADLLAGGSTSSPATPSGAAPSGARRSSGFKSVYSIFVSPRGRVHREARAAAVARRAGAGRHRQRQAHLGG